MASASKTSTVSAPKAGVRYIVFGRDDQMGRLRAHLGRSDVFSMESFGPDAEQPLTEAQQNLVLQAVSFAEADAPGSASPLPVVCCCPGGTNRSVFLAGVLRLRRMNQPSLADLPEQPVNTLYLSILRALVDGAELKDALLAKHVRPSRKRKST